MPVIIKPSDTLDDVVAKINREIDSRRSYGIRRECIPEGVSLKHVYGLMWSNGGCRWNVTHPPTWIPKCKDGSREFRDALDELVDYITSCKYMVEDYRNYQERRDRFQRLKEKEGVECRATKSRCQCLDANEILVVGARRRLLEALANGRVLKTLPFYHGSFEARQRGDFCLIGIEIPPPLRKIPVDQLDDKTLEALTEHLLGAPIETAEEE